MGCTAAYEHSGHFQHLLTVSDAHRYDLIKLPKNKD